MTTPEGPDQATESIAPAEGPATAAVMAAGFGAAVLGLLTTLAEASETVKDWLTLSEDVGPLSGKVVYSVVVWLVAWGVGYRLFRAARLTAGVLFVAGVLLGLGLLGTFPVFFDLFAPK